MPILQNESKLERFYLPSTKHLPQEEQAFVDMEVGKLTTKDIVDIDMKDSEVKIGVMMLASRIKGWNLTDANQAEMPITYESVLLFDVDDFAFLADKIPADSKVLSSAEKKT